MAVEPFAPQDFRVFDLTGFADRRTAIRTRVRPKLEGLGAALVPDLAKLYARAASETFALRDCFRLR